MTQDSLDPPSVLALARRRVWVHETRLRMLWFIRLVLVSFLFYGEFFVFDCSSARTRANPFHFYVSFPFTDNCRTYNSMLCILLLRILGPYTLCMLPWDLQFHACYLFGPPKGLTRRQSWTLNCKCLLFMYACK